MSETITATIGCDIGDKESVICILRTNGELQWPKPVRTTREGMRQFFTRAAAHVVIEAGTHSRWMSKLLQELGHQVTVANPRRVQLISESDSKADRMDAELLARLGKADTQLLAPIKHRGDETQADLAVAKTRDSLVQCRTKLVNQVRGLVKSFGERLPKCGAEIFHRKTRMLIPAELKPALEPLYRTLETIAQEIKHCDKRLEQIAKKYPDVEVISQPKGVGVLTALVYLLTLEDKNRFKKSRLAGAYVGLRPKKNQSGDSDAQLRITKAGSPMLRRLLVGSANYMLGPFGEDSDLKSWGLKLAERGGKNARRRAKVAVARKLAVLMHRLWVTGEQYQPIGYSGKRLAA